MNSVTKRNVALVSIGALLLVVFAMDCIFRGHVVVSVAYIGAIFLAALTGRTRWVYLTAILSSALTLVDWFIAVDLPASGSTLAGKVLTLFTIALTTLFCARVTGKVNDATTSATLDDSSTMNDEVQWCHAVIELAFEGVFVVDEKGTCLFVNDCCAAMLGYDSSEQLLGANMFEIIRPRQASGEGDLREESCILLAFEQPQVVQTFETAAWRRDGTFVVSECRVSVIARNGKLTGAAVSIIDLTDRVQRELAEGRLNQNRDSIAEAQSTDLSLARDRLELALIGANVGLWDWNAQTNEVYYSPTYKTQVGFPVDVDWNDFTDWESRIHPQDHDEAINKVQAYFSHQTDEYKSTFRLQCGDGSYRWILAQGRATFGLDGAPLRMIGVHVDINEQVRAESELKRLNLALAKMNEALQESNVELQQFAYVASHDLQTPLRAISGFTQLLEADYAGKIDEQADDYIKRIVGGVKRMQKMINDLLDYSRVESRAAPFDLVSLDEVFSDATQLLETSISETGARVTCDDLPDVLGDRAQLSQLLTNLIGNALKYHRDDPQVHVSASEDENGWTIAVRDNGIGIAKAHHERIFEVFRRLHTRQEYPGTGIGLAICRRIVKRHHGKIWVESEDGQGTIFFINLPGGYGLPPPTNGRI